MLRGTGKVKLIHLLEMLGKEAELEQGRLPSEVNGCMHECPMDEDTTYVQPFYQLRVESSSGYTRSNGIIEFENNNHEEADTLMINHAALSSRRNPANARIVIFSPDTHC